MNRSHLYLSLALLLHSCAHQTGRQPTSDPAAPPVSQPARDCALALCGHPSRVITPEDHSTARKDFDLTSERWWNQSFRPLMNKEPEAYQSLSEAVRQNFRPPSTPGEHKSLAPLLGYFAFKRDHFSQTRMRDLDDSQAETKNWIKEAVPAEHIPLALAVALEIEENEKFLEKLESEFRGNPSPLFLASRIFSKTFYPNISYDAAVKIQARKALDQHKLLLARLSPIMLKALGVERIDLVESAAHGEELPLIVDDFEFTSTTVTLSKLHEIFFGKHSAALASYYASRQQPTSDPAQNFNQTLAALEIGSGKYTEDRCKFGLGSALSSFPSELSSRRMNKLLGEMNRATVEMLSRYVAPDAAVSIARAVEFVTPPSASHLKRSLEKSFHQRFAAILEAAQLLHAMSDADRASLWAILQLTPLFQQNRGLYSYCNGFQDSVVSDHSLQAYDLIYISWFSHVDMKRGLGIAAHEIGHLVSNHLAQLKNPKYAQERACISARHPFQKESREAKRSPADKFYTEEDWADAFSVELIEHLQKQSKDEIYRSVQIGCTLLESDKSEYKRLQPANFLPYDKHSAAYLRLLFADIDSSRAAPECREAQREVFKKDVPRCLGAGTFSVTDYIWLIGEQ